MAKKTNPHILESQEVFKKIINLKTKNINIHKTKSHHFIQLIDRFYHKLQTDLELIKSKLQSTHLPNCQNHLHNLFIDFNRIQNNQYQDKPINTSQPGPKTSDNLAYKLKLFNKTKQSYKVAFDLGTVRDIGVQEPIREEDQREQEWNSDQLYHLGLRITRILVLMLCNRKVEMKLVYLVFNKLYIQQYNQQI